MAELMVTGRIIQVLPPQGGTSKAGNPWRKQEYVLETNDNYPKKICFNFFNDRIDSNQLQIGDSINLYFDLESREYNGRWYTDVRGWRTEKVVGDVNSLSAPAAAPAQPMGPAPAAPMAPMQDLGASSADEDLPF